MDTKDEAAEAREQQQVEQSEEVEAALEEEVVAASEKSEVPVEIPVETVFEGHDTLDGESGSLDVGNEEYETEDSLTYSNGVIEKIVAMATREVPHILGMKGNFFNTIQEQFGAESLTKGVSVDVTDDNRVIVNISVIIEYGSYAPQIFEDVKEVVTERLASMTGLEVAGINLRIENVVTREEYEKAQRRLINSRRSTSDQKTLEAGDEFEEVAVAAEEELEVAETEG